MLCCEVGEVTIVLLISMFSLPNSLPNKHTIRTRKD